MLNLVNENYLFNNKANGIKFAYKEKTKLKRNEFSIDNKQEFQIISKELLENNENFHFNNNKIQYETDSSVLKKSSYTNKNIINSTIFGEKKENKIKEKEYNINENESNELNNIKDNIFLQLYGFQSLNSEEENFDKCHKRKINKIKNKKNKWNEEEYQKIKSKINNNYIPFNGYDIKKYFLSLSEINNIRQIPELYQNYNLFFILIKEKDKFIEEKLIKNIINNFENIYKNKNYYGKLIINSFLKNDILSKFQYNSTKNSVFFDLFISFFLMFINGCDHNILNPKTEKKIISSPLQSLSYLYTYKILSCSIAKLIHIYYKIFLSYRIENIFFKNKEKEYYKYKINSRKIIWKQFETSYLYFKNKEKLFSKNDKGKNEINKCQIQKFSKKIKKNVNCAYIDFVKKIKLNHEHFNKFDINDNNLTITKSIVSCPSSLYNQIKNDKIFKLKLNLYRYNTKKLKAKKMILIHEQYFLKNDFKNIINNKIFNQSIFFMNSIDIVSDFLK